MKKFLFFFFIIQVLRCTTIDYIYPVDNSIRNGLFTNLTLRIYQNGKLKDSLLVLPNQSYLAISEVNGDRQSQLFQLDSIAVQFSNGKTKIDKYCPKFFQAGDTLNGTSCTKDKINIFHVGRTKETYDDKTRKTLFLYTIDTLDYQEAQ
jgi:hypothetical protein